MAGVIAASAATTRSGIKMPATSGGVLDLIFLLSPTSAQLCSGGSGLSNNNKITATNNTDGTGDNFCGVNLTNSSYVTSTVFHMIANYNVLTLTSIALAGVWIPPG